MKPIRTLILVLALGTSWTPLVLPGPLLAQAAGNESLHRPAPTRAVLVAPQPLSPQANEVLRTYRFTWRGVTGAERYRVEVARDARFQDVLYAEESSTTTLTHPNRTLPLGTVFWRVMAVGEYGQSGPPSPPVSIRIVP